MYKFSVINIGVPEDIFSDCCFRAISEVKMRLKSNIYVPIELNSDIMYCREKSRINLDVVAAVKSFLERKKYVEGRDYTVNILIEEE